MIDTDKYEEFENAMNEGRIERVHCLWALAEVKRLREKLDLAEDYIKHDTWMEYAMQVLERDLGDEE